MTEEFLTSQQRERVGREVAMRAPADVTVEELVEATARVLDRLEWLAANAALWETWVAGRIEVAWDESRQEVSLHHPEEDD